VSFPFVPVPFSYSLRALPSPPSEEDFPVQDMSFFSLVFGPPLIFFTWISFFRSFLLDFFFLAKKVCLSVSAKFEHGLPCDLFLFGPRDAPPPTKTRRNHFIAVKGFGAESFSLNT